MRLFTHAVEHVEHLGAYRGAKPVDLGQGTLLAVLRTRSLPGLAARIDKAPALDPAAVHYLPVIPVPRKFICVGLNYKAHRAETQMEEMAQYPDFFLRVSTSLASHDGVIWKPRCSDDLDFEGELAVVIGKTAKHVPAASALDVVAGYTVCNEGSIRDYQFRTSQWTWGKNFDRTGALGPDLVTPDELPRSVKVGLRIATRLNGQVVQSASTADLIYDIPALIAMLSEGMTLEPGDVISTGTPSGVGLARKPHLYMKAGDAVEVEIEGVGCLRNRIVAEPAL